MRFWWLPFRWKDPCDCKMHVILWVQKTRRSGTSLETNMTPRNFNEERRPGVGEAFAWLWAEVWIARLRRFPANYTPSLWRERSLLLLRLTFSLRVVTYQRVLLCHDTLFHNTDKSSRQRRPWAFSYNTKTSYFWACIKKFRAHITHWNGTKEFSSTAKSTSRVDFASSSTSRADVTDLAYDKQFAGGSES